MGKQFGEPVPSPVVLGQITENFRASVKEMTEREAIAVHQIHHKDRKHDTGNRFRKQRGGARSDQD